ncbi:gpW family protein [Acetobacter sp. TBRC 12305]|uniref:Phage head-tail adapter protein n=1 Tax=Acetobacter garciniae TaxID=2817435 RepID=A0A939HIZ2_9PROT|nr:gpW family head-tail joining protein [Acetobacter garciniae]MBO1325303.1 phage head-tail adapter protein [Acetobacter garciniae]MBX0344725.1 gpW family protein [Acetobacter garciniae]
MRNGYPGFGLPQARFNPASSLLAGLSTDQLQAALTSCQLALIGLQSGQSVASVTYAQGDGSKTVTYRQANVADLSAMIRTLQRQLGVPGTRRRALRPVF